MRKSTAPLFDCSTGQHKGRFIGGCAVHANVLIFDYFRLFVRVPLLPQGCAGVTPSLSRVSSATSFSSFSRMGSSQRRTRAKPQNWPLPRSTPPSSSRLNYLRNLLDWLLVLSTKCYDLSRPCGATRTARRGEEEKERELCRVRTTFLST